MEMLSWTSRLTILTHGHKPNLPIRSREALRRFDIGMRAESIASIEGRKGTVDRVVFEDGNSQKFDAIFFHIAFGPACSIPADLGCRADAGGILKVNKELETSVPGIYAAGDITPGSKLAIRAAADGTRAAVGIYRSLLPEERKV
jgi:thioredoxin reductase